MTPGHSRIRFTRAAYVWTAVALLIASVGWYKTINLLVLAGYLLLAMLMVNLRLAWRAASRLNVIRRPVQPAFAGEVFTVTSDLTNESSHAITTMIYSEAGENRSAWMLAPLASKDQRTLTARWSFPRRGRYSLGPMQVDSSYPLGLVHVVRELGADATVQVLPEVGKVNLEWFRRWLLRQNAGEGESARPSRRPTLGTGDVRGLRPYRPGDSLKEIHWRTSARRNQLWVREYERADPLDLVIIVDPYLPEAQTVSHIVLPEEWERLRDNQQTAILRLEWCLSLAATLGLATAETDNPPNLTLVVPGSKLQVITGRAGTAFIREAFSLLADITGTANVGLIPPEAVRPKASRAARVLVTPREDCPILGQVYTRGVRCAEATALRPPLWFTPPESLFALNQSTVIESEPLTTR